MVELAKWVANRIHGPWNCYRIQSQRWMYVTCGYLMEFKPSCLLGLMRRLYLRLLGGERAVHSFSSFLVCEMLLLTQRCRWNVHHSNVVRMKILRPKEKKNLPAGFHLPYSSPVWLYPLAKGLGTWWPRSLPGPSCYMCWMASKKARERWKDHIQKWSQGAGVSSRVRKQDLGRYIIQANLLTSVTFVFLDKLFPIWEVIMYLCI